MYYLWSVRGAGWVMPSGIATSDRSKAGKFSHEEMMKWCKAQYRTGYAEYGYLPVAVNLLEEIAK